MDTIWVPNGACLQLLPEIFYQRCNGENEQNENKPHANAAKSHHAPIAVMHHLLSPVLFEPASCLLVNQSAAAGTTIHCNSGLRPVPKGGTRGIKSE